MTRTRLLATGVATTLLLTAFGPAGTATEGQGTATTTSVPLRVDAAGTAVALGATELTATTDGDTTTAAPWSTVALTLAEVAGTEFGRVVVASDGETNSDGASVDEDTAVGAVAATVGDVLAVADDVAGSATAALTTLDTQATVLEGLEVSATISDALATVDDTGAAARHALAVAGLDLDLAHVLGSVLAELPLADLVTIADALGVTVPVDIDAAGDVAAATEALLVAVADAVAASDLVQPAADALLDADLGRLDALQALLGTAESLDPVGDPAGAVLDLAALLGAATLPADCSAPALGVTLDPASIEAAVAAVVTCLEAAVDAHAASLTDELDALQAAVEDYLDAVAAVLVAADVLEGEGTSLAGLMDDVATLLGDLLAADLVAVGPIAVTQQVRAVGGDLDASSATHTCDVTTLTVVGVAPVDLADCDGTGSTVSTALDALTTTLGAVLDAVGGVDAGDGVALELFGTGQDTVIEDAGVVRATSVLEVLSLTVPDVTVTPCDVQVVGQVVCALGIDLEALLGDALTTVEDLLTDAHTAVTAALTDVSPLVADVEAVLGDLVGLDIGAADGAQAVVDAAIGAVQTVLDDLDLAQLGTGGGATVEGVRVVIDPDLVAEHEVVAAAAPPAPAPDTPTDPTPAPGGGPLPNTGGGAGLVAVLALGAGAWLWRRREDG